MSTYNSTRYGYAQDEYDPSNDQAPIPEDLHPRVKRQALQIARNDLRRRIRGWSISAVGVCAIAGGIASALLAHLGLVIPAAAVICTTVLLNLVMLGLALRSCSRA